MVDIGPGVLLASVAGAIFHNWSKVVLVSVQSEVDPVMIHSCTLNIALHRVLVRKYEPLTIFCQVGWEAGVKHG